MPLRAWAVLILHSTAAAGLLAGGTLASLLPPGRHMFALAQAEQSFGGFTPVCGGRREFAYSSPDLQAHIDADGIVLHSANDELRLIYANRRLAAKVRPGPLLPGKVNLITGWASQYCQSLPTYAAVYLVGVYPGIAAHFEAATEGLKSEYRVAANANPRLLGIRFPRAKSVTLEANGDLLVKTGAGTWRERCPAAWQSTKNGKRLVPVRWDIRADGLVRFAIGRYDPHLELVIDPVISYSTYLANSMVSAVSAATATAADSNGNVYIAGWIEGSNLAVLATGELFNHGGVNAFLIKLAPSGNLLFATYFGGSANDSALGLAIDSSNQPWITGSASSADLPLRKPFQTSLKGSRNAFIAQFSTTGTLLFSSYFGGSGPDTGNGIAADISGNVYITGDTQSYNLPVLQAFQGSYAGGQDAFAAKISATGALVYATYLGGSALDHGAAIAADSAGNAYITGETFSPAFPTHLPFQSALNGPVDAFVTKLGPAGNALIFSTFLGGSGGGVTSPEEGTAIAVDSQANVYVAGATSSTNFPVPASAPQSHLNGPSDAFVVKFNPAGSALIYGTLLGGSGTETALGLAIDPFGAACVVGYSSSPDFPPASPVQSAFGGVYDAFVAILNPGGTGFYFASLWGGSGIDAANAVAADSSGNVYMVGQTASFNYPLAHPLTRTFAGGYDSFALKLSTNDNTMFVNRLYYSVAGRPADPGGLANWAGVLNQGGDTRGQVAADFLAGYEPNAAYVEAAYITVLGRSPDYPGFIFWLNSFNSGGLAYSGCNPVSASNEQSCSQVGLLNMFIASPEFQQRFGNPDNQDFVNLVYVNVLGRPADQAGLAYWVQTLVEGLSRAQLLQQFIISPEYQNSFGNQVLTQTTYFALLMRPPTSAELQTWTNALNNGSGVVSLATALVTSSEFLAGL